MSSTLDKALADLGDNAKTAEIAFFGGSFTAIDRQYMLALLKAAQPYLKYFYGIRVSTRPDAIDSEVLSVLKKYGVTAIELGAQSMDDFVLSLNERGHTAQDVADACALIRSRGFSLGLQMMTGLYGASFEKDIYTARRFIDLRPDTVRIYPTVVMKDTALADAFLSGEYVPYTLEESVSLCAKLILMFAKADIPIIRLGLHYSDSLVKNSLCGNYHPAFKELCESKIFYDSFYRAAKNTDTKDVTVTVNPRSLSKFLGQKKSNYNAFTASGYRLKLQYDDRLGKYDIIIN